MVKDLFFFGCKFSMLLSLCFAGTSYAFSFLPNKKDLQGNKRSWVLESGALATALTIILLFMSSKKTNAHKTEKNKQVNNMSSAELLIYKNKKADNGR